MKGHTFRENTSRSQWCNSSTTSQEVLYKRNAAGGISIMSIFNGHYNFIHNNPQGTLI
jgi:hypothetical protein